MNEPRTFLIAPASPPGGLYEQSVADSVLRVTKEQIQEAADQAREIAAVMMERLGDAAEGVSEVTIEFGLGFEGKAGIPFITEAKASATFAISVKWEPSAAAKS